MASSPLSTGFPSAPFVDLATGNVTDIWRRYLLTLDARTGGRVGTDAGSFEAQIQAEKAARIAADAAETTARIAGDNAEAASRADADSAEATARIDADNFLRSLITAETTARIDGDANIHVWAPLTTGDVPPVLVGSVDGQAIMVAIS